MYIFYRYKWDVAFIIFYCNPFNLLYYAVVYLLYTIEFILLSVYVQLISFVCCFYDFSHS